MAAIDHIPAALLILRNRTGLSQRGTAKIVRKRTGALLTQSMLSQWEGGDQRPSLDSLLSLLDGLGFSLSDLDQAVAEARRKAALKERPPAETSDQLFERLRARLGADPSFFESLTALLEPADELAESRNLVRELEGLREAVDRRTKAMRKRLSKLSPAVEAAVEPPEREGEEAGDTAEPELPQIPRSPES